MFDTLYNELIAYLGNKYTVIKSYDITEEIDLDGVLAVNIDSFQDMHHTGMKDYKIEISINGQTFMENDKDKSIILQMLDFVDEKITDCNGVLTDVVGVVKGGASVRSEQQTHHFTYGFTLFTSKQID